MIAARFSQPPTTSEGALLYRRGQQTMDIVRKALGNLDALDGTPADLNSSDRVVVVADAASTPGVDCQLEGLKSQSFSHIRGTLQRGEQPHLQADLIIPGSNLASARCQVTYHETPTEKVYTLGMLYQEGTPGRVTVRETRGQEGFQIEQERAFLGVLDRVPTSKSGEVFCSANGPNKAEDAALWRAGVDLIQRVEADMARAKELDNGPQDLVSAPGLLVVPNFGVVDSDNVNRAAGWEAQPGPPVWRKETHHLVTLEARLEFDPASGAPRSFNSGFGKGLLLSFEQAGEVQHFRQARAESQGGYLTVDRSANGDLHIQSFHSTRQATLDEEAAEAKQRKEALGRRGFFERALDRLGW